MKSSYESSRLATWIEHAWLERYLGRALTAEENAWFESYILDKPDLLDRVDADSDLRDALSRSAPAPLAIDALAVHAEPYRSRSLATQTLALAASLIVGVGIGFAMRPATDDGLIASPTRIVYDTLRGDSMEARIELGNAASDRLLVEVGLPPAATHITLEIGDAPAQPLALSPEGFVTFVITKAHANRVRNATLRYEMNGGFVSRTLVFPNS